ncbi:MAG: hypothetical protein JW718_05225 [Desulfovibrionaceae bacterium]|nr:hypothetical protein [Desulfovibrionaceae bacterium]
MLEETTTRPGAFAGLPGPSSYRWFRLSDGRGVFGLAALAERHEALELHLDISRWGPGPRRELERDLEWLKAHARSRGLARIVGLRADPCGRPDRTWVKFSALFGFRGHCLVQAAFLEL